MLSAQENEFLTQIGTGTPMGTLMRRYWQPIATVDEMRGCWTKRVRVLGEDLVLFKDQSHRYGLIEEQCPHRRASLAYGIPTEHGIRCPYHGWHVDHDGRCIDQPSERNPTGQKGKVLTTAYPIEELGGLLFGYLGPLPAPLLPRWEGFVMKGAVRFVGKAIIPCNWLQIMENSLDPVHVEWLHQYMRNYVLRKLGKPEKQRTPSRHEKIGFDVFEYGLLKRRILEGQTEADEDWATGHPVVFPNYLKSGSVATPAFQIRVPMDDENTAYWWYRCYTPSSGITYEEQAPEDIPYFTAPVPQLDGSGLPQWEVLDNNSGQDIIAWITQGAITDRTRETLGRSDKGILMYRKMLEEALKDIEAGRDPMNVMRGVNIPRIDLPVEANKLKTSGNAVTNERTGNTAKYSPVLKKHDNQAANAEA